MVVHCEKDNNKKNMNVETEQSVFRDSMTDDNKKHRRDNYVDIYNNSKRICIPGGDGWIYFKVYVAHKSQNAFLSFYIPLLLSELENVDDNAYCFFIRYADPQQHIRIRIHSSNRNTMQILKVANRIFDNARKKGDIAGYSINCYEREIERYGGSKLIELAEKIFASDSNLVIELLKLFYTEDVLDEDTDLIFASLIYDMLIHFWDSSEDVEKHMNMYIQKNEFRKEFKKIKKRFEEVINNIENIIDNRCRKSLENRNLCIKDYRKRMNELELRKELANTKEDIVMSFIHMFCNRVNGDRAWERKMLAYVSHMVHIVNERSKCYKNSIS